MNVSGSGDRRQSFSRTDESGGAKAPSPGDERNLSVKYGGNGSDVEPMSFDAWKSLYERTAVVNTAQLTLSHPQFTEQEYELVKTLNEPFQKGGSRWTVLEIPVDTPREIVQRLLQITEVSGDFFSRTWFIREKSSACLIGLVKTSALNNNGLSEMSIHIEHKYCGKGYGKEAVKAIVEMYKPYTGNRMLMASFSERKGKLTEFLKGIALFYLTEDDTSKLIRAVDCVSEDTQSFSHPLLSKFPRSVCWILTQALEPLSQDKRVNIFEYRGLWALALTDVSGVFLQKCDFVKKEEDTWYCCG